MAATSPSSPDPLPDRILAALAEVSRPLELHQVADRVYLERRGGEWSQDRRDEAVDRAIRLRLLPQGYVAGVFLAVHRVGLPMVQAYELTPTGRHVAGKVLRRQLKRLERRARSTP